MSKQDYEATFDDFWSDVVLNEDGSLNLDQVKRELHDYKDLMGEASKVYYDVSGGMFSKPNTAAHHVISFHEEALMAERHDAYREALNFLQDGGYNLAAEEFVDTFGVSA